MNEPITRRRRQRKRSTSSDELLDSTNIAQSSTTETQVTSDELAELVPQTSNPSNTSSSNNTNPIRTDLLEDFHHADLAESEYSDDTHDWGWDNTHISDDYWHFLGNYE